MTPSRNLPENLELQGRCWDYRPGPGFSLFPPLTAGRPAHLSGGWSKPLRTAPRRCFRKRRIAGSLWGQGGGEVLSPPPLSPDPNPSSLASGGEWIFRPRGAIRRLRTKSSRGPLPLIVAAPTPRPRRVPHRRIRKRRMAVATARLLSAPLSGEG